MGVIKNDVGRPSNKTIMIRRILKLILALIIVGLAVALGYFIKDNKEKNNEIDSETTNEVQSDEKENKILSLDDTIVKRLYSYVKDASNFTINDEGYVDGLCTFYCEDLNTKNMDKDFKMSLAIKNFDLDNITKIKYSDVEKKYKEIFGSEKLPNEFYNSNIYKLGKVKLVGDYYELLGKTPSIDFELGYGLTLVKAVKTKNSIELYEALWYNNEIDAMGIENFEYEYYNTDACGDVSCEIIFKSNKNPDDEQVIKNADSFTQYKFIFSKNKDDKYIFTSVEKVK